LQIRIINPNFGQTTQDAVRHQSFNQINVAEKTPEQVTGVFSVFRLYTLYILS